MAKDLTAGVASKVLRTVNAPYGVNLSARELAACITDLEAMNDAIGPTTFAFFSEVAVHLQTAFVSEMGIDLADARKVATHLASKCPYPLALAV